MTEHALAPNAERDAASPKTAVRGLLLQRKCACGAGAGSSGECESCAAGRAQNLQRKSTGVESGQGVPVSVNETLARPGRPLDADTRDFM